MDFMTCSMQECDKFLNERGFNSVYPFHVVAALEHRGWTLIKTKEGYSFTGERYTLKDFFKNVALPAARLERQIAELGVCKAIKENDKKMAMSQIETVKTDAARIAGRLQALLVDSGLSLKAEVEHLDEAYIVIISEEESDETICQITIEGNKEID